MTVIELLPRVLPLEDEEISAEAGKLLGEAHDDPHRRPHGGRAQDRARRRGRVPQRRRRGQDASPRDLLLVAVGRGPVTDGLNLESTKVQLEKGYVRT